jgi:hypothetical protein
MVTNKVKKHYGFILISSDIQPVENLYNREVRKEREENLKRKGVNPL